MGRLLFIIILYQINPSTETMMKSLFRGGVGLGWTITSLLLFAPHIQLLEPKQKVPGIKEHLVA